MVELITFVAGVLCVVGGLWLLIYGWKFLRLRRIIKTLPIAKIGSLQTEILFAHGLSPLKNLVKIYGKVVAKETDAGKPDVVKSPFTEQTGVYCSYKLTETRGRGSKTLIKETISKPFWLEDDTGRITIDLTGATIKIKKYTVIGSKIQPLPINFYQVLSSKEIKYHLPENRLFRIYTVHCFKESIIKPGDWLYVIGQVVREGKELVIRQKERAKFWDIFYVSDQPEQKVLRSVTYKAILCIIGSIICLIGAIIFILVLASL